MCSLGLGLQWVGWLYIDLLVRGGCVTGWFWEGGESDVCGAGWVLVRSVWIVCVCVCVCVGGGGGGGGVIVDRVGWYWWCGGHWVVEAWVSGCVCGGWGGGVCVRSRGILGLVLLLTWVGWCLGWVVGGACVGGWVGVRVLGWVEEWWMNEQCVVESLKWCVDGWGVNGGAIGCAVEWVGERMIEWAEKKKEWVEEWLSEEVTESVAKLIKQWRSDWPGQGRNGGVDGWVKGWVKLLWIGWLRGAFGCGSYFLRGVGDWLGEEWSNMVGGRGKWVTEWVRDWLDGWLVGWVMLWLIIGFK